MDAHTRAEPNVIVITGANAGIGFAAIGLGRVVTLTAGIPVLRSRFLDNLQGEKRYTQFGAYRTSKMSNILFTYELARRLKGTPLTVNCVDPGPTRTEFAQKAGGLLRPLSKVLRIIMKSAEAGACTPIFLATDPAVARVTGGYFVNCKPRKSAALTYDRAVATTLWDISEKLTSIGSDASASSSA